jgi:hypothetical protein
MVSKSELLSLSDILSVNIDEESTACSVSGTSSDWCGLEAATSGTFEVYGGKGNVSPPVHGQSKYYQLQSITYSNISKF